MERIYWDASVFLAWLKPELYRIKDIRGFIEEAEKDKPNYSFVTSAISLTEVIRLAPKSKPVPSADRDKINNFFRRSYIQVVQVDRRIATKAQELIWQFPTLLHPKDSIHVATALIEGVGLLHSHDNKHLTPLDGKIGDPPLRITEPLLKQTKLDFPQTGNSSDS